MTNMDVKEAVQIAKEYVVNLFEEEQIVDVGLEEVKFDHDSATWEITIGFARSWQRGGTMKYPFDEAGNLVRSYKVVHINDESGRVERLKDRFLVDSFLVPPR
jgi:hypothetical protein